MTSATSGDDLRAALAHLQAITGTTPGLRRRIKKVEAEIASILADYVAGQ